MPAAAGPTPAAAAPSAAPSGGGGGGCGGVPSGISSSSSPSMSATDERFERALAETLRGHKGGKLALTALGEQCRKPDGVGSLKAFLCARPHLFSLGAGRVASLTPAGMALPRPPPAPLAPPAETPPPPPPQPTAPLAAAHVPRAAAAASAAYANEVVAKLRKVQGKKLPAMTLCTLGAACRKPAEVPGAR